LRTSRRVLERESPDADSRVFDLDSAFAHSFDATSRKKFCTGGVVPSGARACLMRCVIFFSARAARRRSKIIRRDKNP
jgi:hypothetical protein